ncbi:MAG: 4'-phosphopantetheinyl transferase family protein [Chitinophagales bacterium]
MPLFYQQDINESTKIGIWKIDEPEFFFLEKVPLKNDVSHPHKRLQHLAGRWLLPYLFPDFPLEEILIADTRKPFLRDEKYHFSISHCGDFAAAIVSSKNRVGVDVELIVPRIEKIQHKFISPEEYELAAAHWPKSFVGRKEQEGMHALQTLIWSAKEAVYKWYGDGLVDFRRHIILEYFQPQSAIGNYLLSFRFAKGNAISLPLHIKFFDRLVLAWVNC